MSYNGIGLPSVRGTATSGHIQSNRSYIRPSATVARQSRVPTTTNHTSQSFRRDRNWNNNGKDEKKNKVNEEIQIASTKEKAGMSSTGNEREDGTRWQVNS
jgi:hypothetical protein